MVSTTITNAYRYLLVVRELLALFVDLFLRGDCNFTIVLGHLEMPQTTGEKRKT